MHQASTLTSGVWPRIQIEAVEVVVVQCTLAAIVAGSAQAIQSRNHGMLKCGDVSLDAKMSALHVHFAHRRRWHHVNITVITFFSIHFRIPENTVPVDLRNADHHLYARV